MSSAVRPTVRVAVFDEACMHAWLHMHIVSRSTTHYIEERAIVERAGRFSYALVSDSDLVSVCLIDFLTPPS